MKQLLVSNISQVTNDVFTLTGKDYNYLVTVLRKCVGDVLPLSLDDGSLIKAKITSISKTTKTVMLKKIISDLKIPVAGCLSSALPCIFLLQWLIKGSRMDAVVRQATETGVHNILPIYGEFSVVKNESLAKMERRARIVREARQQSGSVINTKVFPAMQLEKALNKIYQIDDSKESVSIMFTEKNKSEKKMHQILAKKPKTVIIAVGAEGGISECEESILKTKGFVSCHLDTNVLRAETAALYGIAAVQTLLMEEEIWQLKE